MVTNFHLTPPLPSNIQASLSLLYYSLINIDLENTPQPPANGFSVFHALRDTFTASVFHTMHAKNERWVSGTITLFMELGQLKGNIVLIMSAIIRMFVHPCNVSLITKTKIAQHPQILLTFQKLCLFWIYTFSYFLLAPCKITCLGRSISLLCTSMKLENFF